MLTREGTKRKEKETNLLIQFTVEIVAIMKVHRAFTLPPRRMQEIWAITLKMTPIKIIQDLNEWSLKQHLIL